jgi:hypothetical protein
MYDIFYVSKSQGNDTDWQKIKSKYPLAQRLSNIISYDDIRSKSFTKMFWVIWDDLNLNQSFNLLDYITTQWDNMYVHIFKNGDYYDGICLFPKNLEISQREFNHRFFVEKKEIDIQASTPMQYPVYMLNSYEEYSTIQDNMFWVVWPEIEIIDQSVFSLYFSHHNSYDRRENHVFKNLFNGAETYASGLVLFSKEKKISQREFKHRFLIEKKEHDIIASLHKVYDVVFISYDEPNADTNYNKLLEICPRAKRVHGIKGIHQAHITAAKICNTDMIWIVDGDAVIVDDFSFDLVMSSYDIDCVHVWRSRNPVNDLIYGNGGIKLLPRQLTLDMDVSAPDMTTSISKKFKAVNKVSNINSFNTDEFTTWRSAFRECCKLASRIIERQHEEETQKRLNTWCTVGADRPFGKYAIAGAQSGRTYGLKNKHNAEALRMINNFEWLEKQFNQYE